MGDLVELRQPANIRIAKDQIEPAFAKIIAAYDEEWPLLSAVTEFEALKSFEDVIG